MSDVSALATAAEPPPSTMAELKRRWGIYTSRELKQRCKDLNSGASLIEELIPQGSLSILVGDSGLGKSPLLYQAALCVASGRPFLGRNVSQGKVLYLDFENGLADVNELVTRLSRHLDLTEIPENLLLWNYNDAQAKWSPRDLGEMISAAQPAWAIVDSLGAYSPDIEEKSTNVTLVYQDFRRIIRKCGTSITGVHHLRKPPSKPAEAPPPLEEDPKRWLLQARGSRALINGADIRIGVDHFGRAEQFKGLDGRSCEVALVMCGFGRVRGNLPATFLSRVLDDDEEALGYAKLAGVNLLFNPQQEDAYRQLPSAAFRFKDAQSIYRHGAQATTDFLRKCIGVGIMQKNRREYKKLEVPEQAE